MQRHTYFMKKAFYVYAFFSLILANSLVGVNYNIEEVDRVSTATLAGNTNALDWQRIGSVDYLAVGGQFIDSAPGDSDLRLFRKNATLDQLDQLFSVDTTILSGVVTAVKWIEFDGQFYLAVAGTISIGDQLRLFRFDETYGPQLIQEDSIDLGLVTDALSLDWQVVGSTAFLAVGTNGNLVNEQVQLFSLDTTGPTAQLINANATFTPTLAGALVSADAVAWQQDGSDYLLAVGGALSLLGERLRLYRFNPASTSFDQEDSVSVGLLLNQVRALAWQDFAGETFLIAGGDSILGLTTLRMFRLDGSYPAHTLTQVQNLAGAFPFGTIFSLSTVVAFNGQTFVAVGGTDSLLLEGRIFLLRFSSSSGSPQLVLEDTESITIVNAVRAVDWQLIGLNAYLAGGLALDVILLGPDALRLYLLEFTNTTSANTTLQYEILAPTAEPCSIIAF